MRFMCWNDKSQLVTVNGESHTMVGPSGRGPRDSPTTPRRSQSFDRNVESEAKTFFFFAVLVEQSKFFFLM